MILIHPPVVKPSEPPAGLAALSGALAAHGVRHTLLDANLEGMLWLLGGAPGPACQAAFKGSARRAPGRRRGADAGPNYERSEMNGEASRRRAAVDSPPEGALNPGNCTWTRRARRRLPANLALLRDWQGYANIARYQTAVSEVNRVIERSAPRPARLSLADYGHDRLIPVRSGDLLYAAGHPDENIFYPCFSARLRELLEDEEADSVIGVSLNYLSQALCAFSIIGFLRKERPRARIILGGSLIASWTGNSSGANLFEGLVDRLVSGPGELPLLSLSGVEAKGGTTWLPSFENFPLSLYLAPGPILPYAGSTGCYWRRCSFCPEKAQRQPCALKPPDRAIADLRRLVDKYRPVLIHFVDNAISPALMAALAESPLDAPWYGFARITADLADAEFCRRLRASGCVMLKLGLESGDQRVLDALGKGVDLGTASQALAALTAAGIATYVYLLFGVPVEDLASARKTLDFAAAHSAFIDFLNLAVFNLPVNCEEAHSLDLRAFYEGDLSLYTDFLHPRGFGRREVRAFLDGELKRHPAVRPILLRQPPLFTSNHAPLLHMARARFSTQRPTRRS